MKKIISFTIIMASLLSLFCAVPAEAAFIDEQLYASYDFEENIDGVQEVISGYHTLTHAKGDGVGVGGSNGALCIRENQSAQDIRLDIPNVENLVGKFIKISYWVRWDEKLNAGIKLKRVRPGAALYFPYQNGDKVEYSKGYLRSYEVNNYNKPDEFVKGNWEYIELYFPIWAGYFEGPDAKDKKGDWNGTTESGIKFDYTLAKEYGLYVCPRLLEGDGANIKNGIDGGFPATGGITWYLDDFKVEVEDKVDPVKDVPVISNLKVASSNLIGETAKITYDYLSSSTAEESKAMITVSKKTDDGKTVMLKQDICKTGEYNFVLTEDLLDATLVYSVHPFDILTTSGDFVQGKKVTYTETEKVRHKYVVTPTLSTFDEINKQITANISVKNNTTEDLDVFIIVALYDENGGLVSSEVMPFAAEDGKTTSPEKPLTVAVADNVTSAKAFFWNGTSIDDVWAQGIVDSLEVTR